MAQLPNEQANARSWCEQAVSFRKNNPISTTTTKAPVATTIKPPTFTTTTTTTKDGTIITTTKGGTNGGVFTTATTLPATSTKNYGPSATLDLTSAARADIKFDASNWVFTIVVTSIVLMFLLS